MTRREQALLAGIAALALLLGLLVYWTGRDPARAALVPALPGLAGAIRFGSVGDWLPSFSHCLAFGLLSALALPPRRGWQLGACATWAVIDVTFELGQLPALAAAWQRVFGPGLVSAYFQLGTFDRADVAAALIGAGMAMLVIYCVNQPEIRDVHPTP